MHRPPFSQRITTALADPVLQSALDHNAEVERVTVGITGVEAALAETGTLVLRWGVGRARLASLSVRTHIVLLTPRTITAIMGRVVGVHGPAKTIALLCE